MTPLRITMMTKSQKSLKRLDKFYTTDSLELLCVCWLVIEVSSLFCVCRWRLLLEGVTFQVSVCLSQISASSHSFISK